MTVSSLDCLRRMIPEQPQRRDEADDQSSAAEARPGACLETRVVSVALAVDREVRRGDAAANDGRWTVDVQRVRVQITEIPSDFGRTDDLICDRSGGHLLVRIVSP